MIEKIQKLLTGKGDNYLLPFFWQHGEDDDTLRKYVHVIHDANMGAFCVESRPHPDFAGPGWWSDMDIILTEAKKLGMKVWILDDSHFPTGVANGAVDQYDNSFCRQSLTHRAITVKAGEVLRLSAEELKRVPFPKLNQIQLQMKEKHPREFDDDKVLAVYFVPDTAGDEENAAPQNLADCMHDGTLNFTPAVNGRVMILYLSRNLGFHTHYINMTHAASVRILIDTVYETHWQHYHDEFGKTIEGFFSDEPELGNGILYELTNYVGNPECDFPWSTEIEEELRARLGGNYAQQLYLIWEDSGTDAAARIRFQYMDVLTGLVKKNFSYQIGDWCRAHGVKYIGHMVEDNDQHEMTGAALGHYFRGLAGEDWSGVDDIGGQVYPQGEDDNFNDSVFHVHNGEFYQFMLGKLASSAADIEPIKKGNSMCEIFGAYGWQEGVRLEKYLLDHFMVRGVNHFVPHAFSPKAYPDPDCPPHFYAHGHNPQYRPFGTLMAYANRVLELLNGGRHITPVAVLYTAESNWADHDHVMEAHAVSRPLTENQIEFDFLPQDVFASPEEFHTVIGKGVPAGARTSAADNIGIPGTLTVNTQHYFAVVVPEMKYIRVDFARAVPALAKTGVRVLFVNKYPSVLLDSTVSDDDAAILDAVQENAEVVQLDGVAAALGGEAAGTAVRNRGAVAETKKRTDMSSENSVKDIRDIEITPAGKYVRYLHYEETDGSAVYMFVNEGTAVYEGTCRFHHEQSQGRRAYWYDAWDNTCHKADFDGVTLSLVLEPYKSCLLILEPASAAAPALSPSWTEKRQSLEPASFDREWKRSLVSSINYPAFGDAREVSLPDHIEDEAPTWSGIARYENQFTADFTVGNKYLLEISDASEATEVFVNGRSLGWQIAPSCRYDLTDYVQDGVNDIKIDVATTLERETSTIPDPFARLIGKDVTPHNSSGLNGTVTLYS